MKSVNTKFLTRLNSFLPVQIVFNIAVINILILPTPILDEERKLTEIIIFTLLYFHTSSFILIQLSEFHRAGKFKLLKLYEIRRGKVSHKVTFLPV